LGSSRAEYPPPDIIFADDGGSDSRAGEVSRGGKGMGLVLVVKQADRVNDQGWDGLCGMSDQCFGSRWIVPNRTHLT
jgi:hypothetical protein